MEEEDQKLNKQTKKKMSIRIVAGAGGCGGLAGILLLGGALATAVLVSTFAFKRKQQSNSKSNHNKSKVKEESKEDQDGLSLLVPDSSPSSNHHHPSSGTSEVQNELDSNEDLILDVTPKHEINGGEIKEIIFSNFPSKPEDSPSYDESTISAEEVAIPNSNKDNLSVLKPEEVNNKNEYLEEVEIMELEEEVVDDIEQIPLKSDEKHEELGRGNKEVIVGESNELVEATWGDEREQYDKLHKLGEEFDDDDETCEELVEAAQADQLGVDDNTHKAGEEFDVDEKCEELVEAVDAVNGIRFNEEQEVTIDGDQEIICSDSSITKRNEFETYDLNKAVFLLPVRDGSSVSLSKLRNDDSAEDPLIIVTTQSMERDEAIDEDHIIVEDKPETQLIEAEEKKEFHEVDRENSNAKSEEADQIALEDGEQMELSEYQECLISDDQENLISDKVQEHSLPSFDSLSLSTSENLKKNVSALQVESVEPIEEDKTAEAVLVDKITVEDDMEKEHDGNKNVVAIGEEAVEIVDADFVKVDNNPQAQLIEQEEEEDDDGDDDNNFSSENGKEEAVEKVETNMFEIEKNLQIQSSEEDDDEDNDDDEDSNDDDEEVEESSETTGDSSQDSNAEAIWPAESVQELSQKLKELQADNNKNLEGNIEEERKIENDYVKPKGHDIKEDDGKFVISSQKLATATRALKQPINSINLKMWILSLLVPLLLALWLTFPERSFLPLSS